MLRFMLDSNVCIRALRNPTGSIAAKLDAHEAEICISTVVLHELIHGADRSRRPAHHRELIANFADGMDVLEFGAKAADHSGNIHATLAQAGQVIGAFDMLIAGHARSEGLIVVTNNLKEFSRVDGLRCEDWLA